jgi:hypothetical protein
MKITRDFACDTCGSASIVPPPRLGDSDVVRCQHCKKVLMTWKVYRLLGANDAAEIAKIEDLFGSGRAEWGV